MTLLVVSALAFGPARASHPAGPLAYFPFDLGSGAIAADAAHGRDGAILGGAAWDCIDKAPIAGNQCSLDFDGLNDYVLVPDEAAFDLTTLSIAFWFKLEGPGGGGNVFPRPVAKGNSTTSNGAYSVFVKDTSDPDDIGLRAIDTANVMRDTRNSAIPGGYAGDWHHVTAIYDPSAATTGRLYLDGILIASTTAVYTIRNTSNPLSIGTAIQANGVTPFARFFNGKIDEVRIYDRALTEGEIAELLPVAGVTKTLDDSKNADDAGDVVINTGERWDFTMTVTVENASPGTLEGVTLKDPLPGDLMMRDDDFDGDCGPDIVVSTGSVSCEYKGRTAKVHLFWDIGDMAPGATETMTFVVRTDVNPGGHQEWTSAGTHELNKATTLKGTRASSGEKFEVETEHNITVEVI